MSRTEPQPDELRERSPERAWDDRKPPELDLIEDCVHCGFCLPSCPTYALWGEEMDSPRGRIVLMRLGHEEGAELTPTMVDHFDNCLGCMACVTACPSGVQYDKLIEDTRAQVERRHPRTPRERLLRRLVLAGFTRPGTMRAAIPALAAYHRSGLARLIERRRVLERFPTLRTLARLAPDVRVRAAIERLPTVTAARGARRGRVALLQGCVQRAFFGDVNAATAAVLAAEGFEVHAPRLPRCCGALGLHTGEEQNSLARAKETIAALEGYEHVVVNAAGCGSAMKDYGHILRDDPAWRERAEAFSARVRDATELLAEQEPVARRGPVRIRVAYHDACHLAHAQGVRSQPRELLRGIPELELLEPRDWEICCGSAGIWNILNPEPADELGRRKAERLLETGAEAFAAANPGCELQIAAHLERLGRPLPTYHPMQLLRMSIEAGAEGR
jgi:glycolate oxidase iron-sulfur subunit